MNAKPIYYNNVTVALLTKRGKTVTEKEVFSIEMPTVCTTIPQMNEDLGDLGHIANRLFKGMRIDEKIKLFKENYKIIRIDIGNIIGYTSEIQKPVEEEYE